jgi:hypothetical protein
LLLYLQHYLQHLNMYLCVCDNSFMFLIVAIRVIALAWSYWGKKMLLKKDNRMLSWCLNQRQRVLCRTWSIAPSWILANFIYESLFYFIIC